MKKGAFFFAFSFKSLILFLDLKDLFDTWHEMHENQAAISCDKLHTIVPHFHLVERNDCAVLWCHLYPVCCERQQRSRCSWLARLNPHNQLHFSFISLCFECTFVLLPLLVPHLVWLGMKMSTYLGHYGQEYAHIQSTLTRNIASDSKT